MSSPSLVLNQNSSGQFRVMPRVLWLVSFVSSTSMTYISVGETGSFTV